jgi:osmotically-inducible protein OsmY
LKQHAASALDRIKTPAPLRRTGPVSFQENTMKNHMLRLPVLLLASAAAVTVVTTVAGCGATPTRESTGEYIDDTAITTRVKAAIFNDATLKATEINVETFKGVVQLSGFVGRAGDIDQATAVARSVSGVKSVKNDLRLK